MEVQMAIEFTPDEQVSPWLFIGSLTLSVRV
jgi:hypothetical protein